MFGRRKKRGMDPHSAHIVRFALDIGKEEVGGLIQVAEERDLAFVTERLRRHQDALAEMHDQFFAASENLQELADRTDEIATDIADIEQQLDVGENDQSIHCALATSHLSVEARIAHCEYLA